ncbi:hypothetical protein BD779DRAFT_839658 [Infundibulicybe gibba]|nr:hypothetical protein BD779DRAFT_839658 [Infundibulicybe gibba]
MKPGPSADPRQPLNPIGAHTMRGPYCPTNPPPAGLVRATDHRSGVHPVPDKQATMPPTQVSPKARWYHARLLG